MSSLLYHDDKIVGNMWMSIPSENAEYVTAFKDYEILDR